MGSGKKKSLAAAFAEDGAAAAADAATGGGATAVAEPEVSAVVAPVRPVMVPMLPDTYLIPIDSILLDDRNVRDQKYRRESITELAGTMQSQGQLQPVRVALIEGTGGGNGFGDRTGARYKLVFGHRRLLAARQLGWESIRAEVVDDAGHAALTDTRLIENVQRADMTAVEESLAVVETLEACGGDVDQAATRIGKSPTWVRQRVFLSRLCKAGREAVQEGRLPLGHAIEIAKVIDTATQEELVSRYAEDDGIPAGPITLLKQEVQRSLLSLAVVPWAMDVPTPGCRKDRVCSSCAFNSANHPGLFGEEVEGRKGKNAGPFCGDRKCFDAKAEAATKTCTREANMLVGEQARGNVGKVKPTEAALVKAGLVPIGLNAAVFAKAVRENSKAEEGGDEAEKSEGGGGKEAGAKATEANLVKAATAKARDEYAALLGKWRKSCSAIQTAALAAVAVSVLVAVSAGSAPVAGLAVAVLV